MPFANSITIDASTNALNVYVTRPGSDEPAPNRSSTPPVTSAASAGQASVRFSEEIDARRQATSGPIPISNSSGIPKTRRKKLKYGGPTVTDSPRTASDTIGKITPQRIVRQRATSSRLL